MSVDVKLREFMPLFTLKRIELLWKNAFKSVKKTLATAGNIKEEQVRVGLFRHLPIVLADSEEYAGYTSLIFSFIFKGKHYASALPVYRGYWFMYHFHDESLRNLRRRKSPGAIMELREANSGDLIPSQKSHSPDLSESIKKFKNDLDDSGDLYFSKKFHQHLQRLTGSVTGGSLRHQSIKDRLKDLKGRKR